MSSDLFSKVLLGHRGHIKPADKNPARSARVRIIFQHLLTTSKNRYILISSVYIKDIINFCCEIDTFLICSVYKKDIINGYCEIPIFHCFSQRFKIKIFCFQFKGWNQPYHQPVLKFPLFLHASQQEKSAGISKLVDDKTGSIL